MHKFAQRRNHISASCGIMVSVIFIILQVAESWFLQFSPFCKLPKCGFCSFHYSATCRNVVFLKNSIHQQSGGGEKYLAVYPAKNAFVKVNRKLVFLSPR